MPNFPAAIHNLLVDLESIMTPEAFHSIHSRRAVHRAGLGRLYSGVDHGRWLWRWYMVAHGQSITSRRTESSYGQASI